MEEVLEEHAVQAMNKHFMSKHAVQAMNKHFMSFQYQYMTLYRESRTAKGQHW